MARPAPGTIEDGYVFVGGDPSQKSSWRLATGPESALADARKRAASTPGAVRAFSQGASYNFADNIDANLAAATTAVNQALGGALFGKKNYTPSQAKWAVNQAEREASAAYGRSNPVASNVAGIAGAIASPVNWALAPVATAAKLGKAAPAIAGALGGGLAGAGQEGAQGIAPGAAIGGVLGGLLPPVFNAGLQMATPAIQRGINAIPQNVRNAVDAGVDAFSQSRAARVGAPAPAPRVPPPGAPPRPQINPSELKTARALQNAIERDARAGVKFTPGANPMYEGGENLAGLYEAAANFPGAAKQQIRTAANQNRAQTATGVASDISSVLGGKGDFFSYQENLVNTQKDNARRGMEKLADQLVTLDENSILALRSDKARAALKNAAENMRSSVNPDTRAQAGQLMQVMDQVFDKPSGVTLRVRDAQNISEKLLSSGQSAFRSGDNDTGFALKELGRAIRDNARDPNRGGFSEYDSWLKQYGLDAQNKDALELGKDVFNREWPEAVARELDDMGPAALIHYRKGVAEALMNRIRGANGDMRLMRDILNDQNQADKIRLAFPDDASFAAFLKSAEQRVQNTGRNAQFLQNSRTANREAMMADLEDQANPLEAVVEGITNPTGIPGAVVRAGAKRLPMFAPVKGVLRDPEANAALGRTALDPDEVTRLLNLLQIVRAQQAGATQAVRSMSPAVGAAAVPMVMR